MVVPAFASAAARRVTRQAFADLSWRRRTACSRRLSRLSVLIPVVVGALAYSTAAVLGLVGLRVPSVGLWVALVAVNTVLNLVLATGEGLGWRGYLVPQLVAAGVPAPLFVSGLVWGLWHVLLFLWGGFVKDGPAPWVSTLLVLVLTVALGLLLGAVRLAAGTVWSAVTLHVAWNVVIQTGFDPLATGADRGLWVGEVGVFTIAVVVLIAVGVRAVAGLPGPRPATSHHAPPVLSRGAPR